MVYEFGNGGDKFLNGVQCGGNEANLLDCLHDEIGRYTCYFRVPGVSCGNFPLHPHQLHLVAIVIMLSY